MDSMRARPLRALGLVAPYLLLCSLGAMEGLIGSFQFSHTVGPVPVAALAFCLLIFLTCSLAAVGMGSALAGTVAALGWFAATMALAAPTAQGSIIVTNTTAGIWYLYGGVLSAGLGIVVSLRWRPARRRGGGGAGTGAGRQRGNGASVGT